MVPFGVPHQFAASRKSDQAPRRGGEMLVCQRKLLDDARGNVLARLCNLPQLRNPFNHTWGAPWEQGPVAPVVA